jgi:hypothetical protein
MTAYEWFICYLTASGSGRSGRTWQCPAHDDASPSLSVTEGQDGIVLLYCFAGCATESILRAMGLGVGLLFESHPYPPERVLAQQAKPPTYPPMRRSSGSRSRPGRGHIIEVVHHVYVPDLIRLERRRYADNSKDCSWGRKTSGGWNDAVGLELGKLPVYQEDQVLMGVAGGEPIILCESESSVDALMKSGIYSTTWAGGASSPQIHTLRSALSGGRVIVIPDHDDAGLLCRDRLVEGLHDVCDISVLLPAKSNDARDLLTQWGPRRLHEAIADLPVGHSSEILMAR